MLTLYLVSSTILADNKKFRKNKKEQSRGKDEEREIKGKREGG